MLGLTSRRRAVLAEKFGDLANLAFAALVFGQAVGDGAFSMWTAAAGSGIWLVAMAASYALAGGEVQ